MSLRDYVSERQSLFAVLGVLMLLVQAVGVTAGAAAIGGGSDAAVQPASELSTVADQTNETNATANSTSTGLNESANESRPSRVPGDEYRNGAARSDSGLLVPAEREVEVGETVVLGYRYTGCGKLFGSCSGFNYDWNLYGNGADPDDAELLHDVTDTMPDEIAHGGRANTFRATEPGEYVITAYRTPSGGDSLRDSVTIEVTEEDYAYGKSKHELLQEYSPVLKFHEQEEFYPTRFEAYVENSKLMENDPIEDDTVVPGTSLFDLYYEEGSDPSGGGDPYDRRDNSDSENEPEPFISPETEGTSDHADYQENVVDDEYPQTVYGSVANDVDFRGNTYTALSYHFVYIHDPKPYYAPPAAIAAASHTGDQEGFTILLNESGPQYVAAKQHFGGERRAWQNVEKDDDRPVVYVGEGSHPTLFGPKTDNEIPSEDRYDGGRELKYLYQQQYLCNSDGGPPTNVFGCSASDSGDTSIADINLEYYDPIDVGEVWQPDEYDVTLLTGEEAWTEYDGDVYRYYGPTVEKRLKSSFVNQRNTMDASGIEDFVDQREDSGNQREAFPTTQQVDADLISNPSQQSYDVEYSLGGEPVTVEYLIENTGSQPHEFVVGQRGAPETKRNILVETGQFSWRNGELQSPGSNRGTLPVSVTGSGPWEIESQLSVYENSGVLDTETLRLERTEPADIEVVTNVVSAGSADSPGPVTKSLRIERNGQGLSGVRYPASVTVGGREGEFSWFPLDKSAPIWDSGPDGDYTVKFVPPEQPSAGTYNMTIEFQDGTTVEQSDAVTYGGQGGVQVAANIQIDRSGSMDDVIDEAKEGGATFVEQSDEDDYISVVSYANNARTEQSLVELSDGRSDTIDAIEGINAYGGTNIGASLEQGLDTLDSAPDGTTKAAILMTDGRRNDGPSRQEILDDIVPQYNDAGVCLYTIGFGSGADEDLLEDIADASDCGGYRFAGEEGEVDSINQTLQSVYQDLGGEVSDAETIASEGGTVPAGDNTTGQFVVDDSVSQTTANLQINGLVDPVSPAPGADEPNANIQLAPGAGGQSDEIRLVRPDGTVVNTSDANVSKSVVGDTVIYRIDDPQPGNWSYELRNTQSDDAQYSVDITGEARTELDVYTSAETYSNGSTANVTATLVGPDGGVGNASVNATVTLPDGNTTAVSVDERTAGVYDGAITTEQAGEYTVEVTATGQNASLERQATTTFTVDADPSLSISQSDTPEIVGGTQDTFAVDLDDTTGANYSLQLSTFTAVNGTATIPSDGVWLWNDSVAVPERVNVTASVGPSMPAGTYEATLRAYNVDSASVVTETVSIEVLEPATFEVEPTTTNATVEGGESLNLSAVVTNTGDVNGTQNVSLSVYGVGSNTTELTLASGNSTTVEFSVPTTVADNGTRYAVVASETDRNETQVGILGPAYVVVGVSEATVLPSNETNATLETTVVNRGDETATQELTLTDENGTVATRNVTLDPGESRRVNFTYSPNATAVGDNMTLTSANTSANTTFITQAMSYADADGVVDSRGLDIAVLDWKEGEISRAVLDRVIEYYTTGREVY